MPRDVKTAAPAPKAKLAEYARKRDFARTPEPPAVPKKTGKRAAKNGVGGFVVQKHDARRLHYDLRLELDGVLKSWAITRGPSLTLGEKRLAVRTEDHPMQYLDFEGNIPKGEYGGGSMIVWDRGRWQPEGDPRKGLEKGHLDFTLTGDRLNGRWHLVRMRPKPGERSEPWLLIKSEDEFARHPGDPEITDEEDTSQLSGLTNKELATEGGLRADHKARTKIARERKRALPDIAKIKGARKGLLPTFLPPMLASPCEKPPSGPHWVHEIKHDGYRIQARVDGDKVKLLTRKALDWVDRFPAVAAAVKQLGLASALIDGEIVVEDAGGLTSLNDLQADLEAGRQDRFRYFVFDLYYCEGFDLTGAALVDRKALLQAVCAGLPATARIRYSEHLDADGPTMLEHSCRLGLEGIISKRKDLPYRAGRAEVWLKSKCRKSQEFVIVGFVPSTAASRTIGSLCLGYYAEGELLYAGRVGTGWSLAQARSLYTQLDKLRLAKMPVKKPLPEGAEKGAVWVTPQLVGEVEYRDWTRDGLIRQSVFKGLRQDKPADEVVLETKRESSAGKAAKAAPAIQLTHPERILWPETGLTKQGLAEYYADIADWILPHVTGRVLSLLRAPSGVNQKGFFAKHEWAGLTDAVRRVDVGDEEPMLAIDDVAGLLNLVQSGVVEIHPWGSRVETMEKPDRLIFDLDPGEGVAWPTVTAAAIAVRDRVADLGLKSFLKTTGGKGLHIVVPVTPTVGWKEAKAFTAEVAEGMARERPDLYVATMAKRARGGRIFIDYFRNDRGSTAVAAYSTRVFPRATVSTPLDWDELSDGLRSDHFTVANIRHRLEALKRDPWAGFFKLKQKIPAKR